MEWYKILLIIICTFSAFGWLVHGLRLYKRWQDRKDEPILTHLDYVSINS